jgi:hypothetical protein
MDEDSQFGGLIKATLAATGLGAAAAVFAIPFPYGVYVAVLILVLALLLFGGYFIWRRLRARREREQFTSAIETQTAAAPKAISDPTKRAELDRVRQKFQTGLQEFKSRSKDIYKLPWYVIIGESGSGKTEAIRHSGIDFPPGLQDELQGSGGTVNMDWWFTNRGIILDTAGSMLFNEARAGESPEWREFLRLLKRSRPHSPINGLFLVLSVESLIRDSADTIAQKASRLAQQLDIIQRALDVRFPVYLLVTKCDLLIGFREFFDSIDDPLLQHQIFGWSNPDPLDGHFRSDLVEQYLRTVAARLRRRRMALIREISGTGRLGDTDRFFASNYQLGRSPTAPRRLDQLDSLFALPESIMRLAPRLQRYLETIFVAGEWSAKPVFLRGIYFTSSMREGKALDEAIALATGLPLDQLPEDRSWDKNRAFFLRDLFHEKVFRESGLVTRATNTLKMLRRNQLITLGTAGAALLLVLLFAGLANHKLKQSVKTEAAYWKAGAAYLNSGEWSPNIINDSPVDVTLYIYSYGGSNGVQVGASQPTLVRYQETLCDMAATNLPVPWIFRPMFWIGFGKVRNRPDAQRRLFESSVLRPLVWKTQEKMRLFEPSPSSLTRHREALHELMELEASGLKNDPKGGTFQTPGEPTRYLKSFLAYLTDRDVTPDAALVRVFERTYSAQRLIENDENWPPHNLRGGNTLSTNTAIGIGLTNFDRVSRIARTNINIQLELVNEVVDNLRKYELHERNWLTNGGRPCPLPENLLSSKTTVDDSWKRLQGTTNFAGRQLTNFAVLYSDMAATASNASAAALSTAVKNLSLLLPAAQQGRGLFKEIADRLGDLGSGAADTIWRAYEQRRDATESLDTEYVLVPSNSPVAAFQARWELYTNACALVARSPRTKADLTNASISIFRIEKNLTPPESDKLGLRADNLVAIRKLISKSRSTLLVAFTNNLSERLGFPVVLGRPKVNTVQELAMIKNDLEGLLASLQDDPVWKSDPSRTLPGVASYCSNVVAALAALVRDDGAPVQWQLIFVPPADNAPQGDREIINILPAAKISSGTLEKTVPDLSKCATSDPSSCSFGIVSVNDPLSISFSKFPDSNPEPDNKFNQTPDWALIRLIRTNKAERLGDGTRWRFQIPLSSGTHKGNVTFEAQLDSKVPLPKLENWP